MNDSSMKAKFEQLQAFRETLTRATNRDEMTANYRAVMDKRRELGMPNHGRKYDYDWIVRLRSEGKTLGEIERITGAPNGSIRHCLRRHKQTVDMQSK